MISRLTETIGPELPFLLHGVIRTTEERAESPIEALLAAAILIRLGSVNTDRVAGDVTVLQQYQWESYRIDIALIGREKPLVFVECDGHEFHERTKEQAERDRSRDRAIQLAGIAALRFTGKFFPP